jgi:competence protein ComEA
MPGEPAEWHSFGDVPSPPPPVDGNAGVHVAPGATGVRRPGRRPVGQNAWLAVGATVLSVVVGVAVFAGTLTFAGGRHDQVTVAARGTPAASPRAVLAGSSVQAVGATAGAVAQSVLVDVEGAVREPGLHRVPAGARVGDAIAAAGGYADRADLEAAARTLNLAEPLADGAKIRVPLIGDGPLIVDLPAALQPSAKAPDAHALIDLNHGDEAALDSLPGIGPVTAAKIIEARASAPFASLEDLVTRNVLSASVLDKLRGLAMVTP